MPWALGRPGSQSRHLRIGHWCHRHPILWTKPAICKALRARPPTPDLPNACLSITVSRRGCTRPPIQAARLLTFAGKRKCIPEGPSRRGKASENRPAPITKGAEDVRRLLRGGARSTGRLRHSDAQRGREGRGRWRCWTAPDLQQELRAEQRFRPGRPRRVRALPIPSSAAGVAAPPSRHRGPGRNASDRCGHSIGVPTEAVSTLVVANPPGMRLNAACDALRNARISRKRLHDQ